MMMMKQRWGDVLDEEEIGQYVTPLPAPMETGPDSRGVKTFVSWKRNDKGELVKMTTRVRVAKTEKKTYKVQLLSCPVGAIHLDYVSRLQHVGVPYRWDPASTASIDTRWRRSGGSGSRLVRRSRRRRARVYQCTATKTYRLSACARSRQRRTRRSRT